MPTLTTQVVVNTAQAMERPIHSILIKMTNNGTQPVRCYLLGFSINGNKTIFAQELFQVEPDHIRTRTFNAAYNYFQFDFVISQDTFEVQVFGITANGMVIAIPLVRQAVRRITSDLRVLDFTPDETAVISFRRKDNFENPNGAAAAVWPEGISLLINTAVRYSIVAGGAVNGDFVSFPTPSTNLDDSQTSLLVNYTCNTVTGGNVIYQGTMAGLSGAYTSTDANLVNQGLLYYLTDTEPVTLVVSSLVTGIWTLVAAFRMLEGW